MKSDKSSVRILIVDDEYMVADEIRCGLEKEGYTDIGIALNNKELQPLLKGATKPDIVLMDIAMKGPTNGIKTTLMIQEEYKIPSIFVTGANETLINEAYQVSNHLIRKPIDSERLSNEIEIVLGRSDDT